MGNDNFLKLMKFLAYVLDGDEYDHARELANAAMSDVGIAIDADEPATDRRKSAADSRYAGVSSMIFDIDIKVPTRRVVRGVQRYEAALAEVAPYVGDVRFACDSADAVYKAALKQLGHDVSEIKVEGVATALWPALKNRKPAQSRTVAMDAKATERRAEMFPNGNRLVSEFR